MSVDPVPGFFAPVAAFPFPDDRFGEVWCSLSTRSWTRPASGERPTTPSLAAPLTPARPRAVFRKPAEVDLTEIRPMSVFTEVTVAPALRSAAATARASAPRSARTTYVPDPAVDTVEAVVVVVLGD